MASMIRMAGGDPAAYTASPPSVPIATYVLLATIPEGPMRANVAVQNQSAATIQVVRGDPSGNNQVSILLASGGAAGAQGASWDSNTFKGRVLIYGPSGSQIAAWED